MAKVSLRTLQTYELASGCISVVALVFSLILFTDVDMNDWDWQAPNAALTYWTPQTLWMDASKAQVPAGAQLIDTDEVVSLKFRNSEEETGDRKTLIGTVSNVEPGKLRVWVAFFFIFGFSAAFQLYRGNALGNSSWDPRRPDITRWLEYALTAPWQILLIAGTVQLHDLTAWYGLFAAEVALMFIGYAVELAWFSVAQHNDAVNAQTTKEGEEDLTVVVIQEPISSDTAVAVLTTAGWFVHLAIFAALGILKYLNSKDYFDQLNPDFDPALNWTPIDVTIFGQFILFSTFGLVQLGMLGVLPFILDWIDVEDEAALIDEIEKSAETPINRVELYPSERNLVKASFLYGVLSVTSKLFLEIVFIWVFAAMPGFEVAVN